MKFYKGEVYDLVKSWLAIAIIFTLYFNDLTLNTFLSSLIIVGMAFVLHELGHKFTAQKYGVQAYYKSFDNMLVVSLFLSLIGLLFIAPGAVMMKNIRDRIRLGRIAAAGPLMNIILAIISLSLFFVTNIGLFSYSARINAFLATFNLLPIFVLDGKKVLNWNKKVYFTMLIISICLILI